MAACNAMTVYSKRRINSVYEFGYFNLRIKQKRTVLHANRGQDVRVSIGTCDF